MLRLDDNQPISIRERVGNGSTEGSWITFFHVRAGVIESDTSALVVPERVGVPDHLVEAAKSAVQTVRAIVDGKAVNRTVECESSTRNPVAIAADDRAEVGVIVEIPTQAVIAEDDVIEPARAVRRLERGDDPAVVGEPHFDAVNIRESEQLDSLSFRCSAEWRGGQLVSVREGSLS